MTKDQTPSREEVIAWARDCNIAMFKKEEVAICDLAELKMFASLAYAAGAAAAIKDAPDYKIGYADGVAAEREACAEVCEEQEELRGHTPFDCAAAIRARGQA